MYRNLAIDYDGEDPARLIGRRLTSAIDTVRAAAASVAHWHKRRIATRRLMALDDHTLKDIGFSRGASQNLAGRTVGVGGAQTGRGRRQGRYA